MKEFAISFVVMTLSFSVSASDWQCFVGLRDGTTPRLMIQADSEQAAKTAALQTFGGRAWGPASVGCMPQAAVQAPQPAAAPPSPPAPRAGQSAARREVPAPPPGQQAYRCTQKAGPGLTAVYASTSLFAQSKEDAERQAQARRPMEYGWSCGASAKAAKDAR
jgi:hypothetical protein